MRGYEEQQNLSLARIRSAIDGATKLLLFIVANFEVLEHYEYEISALVFDILSYVYVN